MYSYSLSFMLLDNKDRLALAIVSTHLKPFSTVTCDSVDHFDGSTCTLATVTFRSDCEWYAKHKLLAFSYGFEFLRNLPFPDSVHLDYFEDDEVTE